MTSFSQVMSENGKRLTEQFFIDNGVPEEYFEDAPTPTVGKNGKPIPDPDPEVMVAGLKKKSWF